MENFLLRCNNSVKLMYVDNKDIKEIEDSAKNLNLTVRKDV